jgi:hypothetical protein
MHHFDADAGAPHFGKKCILMKVDCLWLLHCQVCEYGSNGWE